jgi:hypothetical protein
VSDESQVVTPEQWAAATPQQRDQYVARFGPAALRYVPAPAPVYVQTGVRQTNPVAIIGIIAGLLGLLIVPIVLGPVALIMGAIGYVVSEQGRALAVVSVVLGALDLIVALALMAAFA